MPAAAQLADHARRPVGVTGPPIDLADHLKQLRVGELTLDGVWFVHA